MPAKGEMLITGGEDSLYQSYDTGHFPGLDYISGQEISIRKGDSSHKQKLALFMKKFNSPQHTEKEKSRQKLLEGSMGPENMKRR